MTHGEPHGTESGAIGHETRDISTRVVVVFGLSLVAGAVVVLIAVWGLFLYFWSVQARAYPRQFPMAVVGPPPEAPEPRLQAQPREELKKMRADEGRYLGSYGWVDAARGTVHIPIDRAMQLLVQQGLPARAADAAPAPGGMPERSSSGRTTVPHERY